MKFYGHLFSGSGISPLPERVAAIKNLPELTSSEAVRSLLGLVQYCACFIPDLATISQPLRELTKASVKWSWGEAQRQALQEIKEKLSADCTMAYFDPNRDTEIVVDASPVSLGAILKQRGTEDDVTIVAVASRSQTAVEQRYSQTEREALAVTWGILHYHLYVYGHNFKVVTDHRPLPANVQQYMVQSPSTLPAMDTEAAGIRL